MTTDRPLFIPMTGKFYDAFADGSKDTEYRLHGTRWNLNTCHPGRRVVLSRGYGKQHRMTGVIVDSNTYKYPDHLPGWVECYGLEAGTAVCLKIKLDPIPTK